MIVASHLCHNTQTRVCALHACCPQVWDSGFISIPYNFKIQELSDMVKMLQSGQRPGEAGEAGAAAAAAAGAGASNGASANGASPSSQSHSGNGNGRGTSPSGRPGTVGASRGGTPAGARGRQPVAASALGLQQSRQGLAAHARPALSPSLVRALPRVGAGVHAAPWSPSFSLRMA